MGKIILLNTPIGNLGDLTERVREALKLGSVFAVEDTRVFKELLNHLGISLEGKRVFSFHDQSEESQLEKLVSMALAGDLYVASEAGSPIVSDPAYPLIRMAYAKGIEVDSYSGVSSPVMALELSGLPPLPFTFHGFLPRESGKKIKAFEALSQGTHIFFEAPTRIEETVDELASSLPDAEVSLVRELSKKFQQVVRFKARDWQQIKATVMFKGEFILLVHQKENSGGNFNNLKTLANEILEEGASPKQVAKLLGEILERPTKEIYSQINRQKKSDD